MTGGISVDTIPSGADVYIEEKYAGNTEVEPVKVSDISPGTYGLRIESDNFPFIDNVIVNDWFITKVTVDLENNERVQDDEYIPIPHTQTDVLTETTQSGFNDLKDILTRIEAVLNPPKPEKPYYNDEIIQTAVLTPQPDNLSAYQFDDIHNKQGMNRNVYVKVYGPGSLYAVVNHTSNANDFSNEILINEGKSQLFDDIFTIGTRSPVVGCRYIVSERELIDDTGEVFTGSRFLDRRDRKGTVIYKDDYESPTAKYRLIAPGGGTINRSTATAWAGDYSINFHLTGGNDNIVAQYVFPDIHTTRLGAQFRFRNDLATGTPPKIKLFMNYSDNVNIHAGMIVYNLNTGDVSILNQSQGFTSIGTVVPVTFGTSSFGVWNSIKMVIDENTNQYVKIIINSTEIDITQPLLVAASFTETGGGNISTSAKGSGIYLEVDIEVSNTGPNDVFVDDFIVTEDEP